jgi:hypothetical protein
MLGNIFSTKYTDLGSPIVDVHISNICISNTLIDLGYIINVMTKETMEKLQLNDLHQTTTILQLAYRSIVQPEGILEDVVIYIESWDYPTDFMVLQPKSNLGGYPLIFGRPWLAIVNVFIGCRSRDMNITQGSSTKKITLYPPYKPSPAHETPMWIGN